MESRSLDHHYALNPADSVGAGQSASAKDLLDIVWGGRWLILLSVAACVGAAWAYLVRVTPQYASSARIFVEQSGPRIITNDGGVMAGAGNYLATQCEVLKSGAIMAIALESGGFDQMKTFAGANPGGSIRAGLEVEMGRNNDIITVTYTGPVADEAAEVVNRVVDAYKTFHSRQRRSTAAEVLTILRQEKVKWEGELRTRLQAKLDYVDANSDVNFDAEKAGDKGNIVLQRLAGLTGALTSAQLNAIEAKSNYASMKEIAAEPARLREFMLTQGADGAASFALPGTPTSPQARLLRERIGELREQLDAMSDRAGPNHPQVRARQAELDRVAERWRSEIGLADADFGDALAPSDPATSVEQRDQRLGEIYLLAARQRWEIAKRKEEEIGRSFAASIDEQRQLAIEENKKSVTFAALDAEYRRTQQLCDQIQNRINEIRVTEDAGALNVTVLEPARPAARPGKPDRPRTMSAALMLGGVLGCGLAFLRGWLDQRLRSPEEIQAVVGASVLGAIPDISGKLLPATRGKQVHLQPTTDVAEAYRTIRTAIYFGTPDAPMKTLLITSPQAGDGKTTSASNLAIAMAQAGQKTLLLDADFRRPTQHKIFGVEPGFGLSGVLAGRATLDAMIRPSGVDNLSLLPCGPLPPNPAEVLNSQAFSDILMELSRVYDHVVVDSPPVMPVTDARILGAMCDATILVFRAEKTTGRVAAFARDMLEGVGTNILGVIVNGVPRRRGRRGYYGYYYDGDDSDRGVRQHENASEANGNGHSLVVAEAADRMR